MQILEKFELENVPPILKEWQFLGFAGIHQQEKVRKLEFNRINRINRIKRINRINLALLRIA